MLVRVNRPMQGVREGEVVEVPDTKRMRGLIKAGALVQVKRAKAKG